MGCIKLDILEQNFSFQKVAHNNLKYSTKYHTGSYLFGFGGMEKDDEIHGSTGTSYTTEFRQYDPRIGRWLSIDPLYKNFAWQSPYVAFDNNPIFFNDPKGLAAQHEEGEKNTEKTASAPQLNIDTKKAQKINEGLQKAYQEAYTIANVDVKNGYEKNIVDDEIKKNIRVSINLEAVYDNFASKEPKIVDYEIKSIEITPRFDSKGKEIDYSKYVDKGIVLLYKQGAKYGTRYVVGKTLSYIVKESAKQIAKKVAAPVTYTLSPMETGGATPSEVREWSLRYETKYAIHQKFYGTDE